MNATPQAIAEKGERIYKEKYQQEYEKTLAGKFVAIDINTEKASVADSPEEAFEAAQKDNPGGYYHLIKIGSPGVYRAGYTSAATRDWIFQ